MSQAPDSSQEKSSRLLVVRERELEELLETIGGSAALLSYRSRFTQWAADHSSNAQLGRPPIPLVIVEFLAKELFNTGMRQRWNQGRLEGAPPAWDDSVNGPNADHKDEWRGAARTYLMQIWDDLVSYFSTQGVLFWTRLTPEDCEAVLGVLEGGADAGTVERADAVKPLLREAAEKGGRA